MYFQPARKNAHTADQVIFPLDDTDTILGLQVSAPAHAPLLTEFRTQIESLACATWDALSDFALAVLV